MLNRNDKTIWSTYNNAKRKYPEKFIEQESKVNIPISIFSSRKLSVLESIVHYLKENYDLSFHEIALLLKRDDRTIWTTYQKAKKKLLGKVSSKEPFGKNFIKKVDDKNLGSSKGGKK